MLEHPVLWGFIAVVTGYLFLDLGFLHKHARALTFRQAIWQSLLIVFIALAFGIFVFFQKGGAAAAEYYSAYVIEYALSMDNIFVILLIFRYFSIDPPYYHRVLFWGVVGAIIMRGIFIFAGTLLVRKFQWILYIFGAFLIWAGIKNLFFRSEEPPDLSKSPLLRVLSRYLRITTAPHEGRFILTRRGKRFFTLLALALLMVEFTDLLFAIDSIPAAFAITRDEDILFSSNILAVMGLRSMFFVLAAGIERFWALEYGISIVLIGIGLKMFQELFHLHVSAQWSLAFILITLGLSIVISLIFPKYHEPASST
ncbi:MAG: TerC/Alx family metal homeostasis membrane protein [Bacteroidia bacterium]|nr:TerC/Alx family metal homeostasis membrane protein [Bacteroidia bacterium]MDW8015987.1 TerC/Alx family metal homeostasis membrane protein [Bacteroidia bacterium]